MCLEGRRRLREGNKLIRMGKPWKDGSADIKGQRSNACAMQCTSTRARSGASSAVKSAMASRLRHASKKLRSFGTTKILYPSSSIRPCIAVVIPPAPPPTPRFCVRVFFSFLLWFKVGPFFGSRIAKGAYSTVDHGRSLLCIGDTLGIAGMGNIFCALRIRKGLRHSERA